MGRAWGTRRGAQRLENLAAALALPLAATLVLPRAGAPLRAARAQLLEAVPILVPGACPSQGGIGNQAPSVALSDHQWWLLQPGRTYGELFVDFTVSDANVIGANGTQDRLIGRWSFAQQPEHSRLRDEDILNGLVFANESGVYSTNYTALTGTSDELFWTLNVSEVEWFDRSPAAFVPDAAGLYVVSLNVTDACNATADEVTNITLRCDYDPRAGLTHNAARASVMNGRRALRFADFEHPLGWFEPVRLDGSASYAEPMGWYDPTLEPYRDWVDAPVWDVPFQADGLLYEWAIRGAPPGSVLAMSDTEPSGMAAIQKTADEVVQYTPQGARILHANSRDGNHARAGLELPIPRLTDPTGVWTRFSPDVVGFYDFDLTVSNACTSEVVNTSVYFTCNSPPDIGMVVDLVDEDICMDGAVYNAEDATMDIESDPLYFRFKLLDAPNASLSTPLTYTATLSDYEWSTADTARSTYLYPDMRGEYTVQVEVTDGCTVSTLARVHDVRWRCTDMAIHANAGLCLYFLGMVIGWTGWHIWRVREDNVHPLSPIVIREDAARLIAHEEAVAAGRCRVLQASGAFEKSAAAARTNKAVADARRSDGASTALDLNVVVAAKDTTGKVDLDKELRLLPPRVATWRLLRVLCVIAEGVTFLSLSLTPNTWFHKVITTWFPAIALNLPAPLVHAQLWGFFVAVVTLSVAPLRPFGAGRHRRFRSRQEKRARGDGGGDSKYSAPEKRARGNGGGDSKYSAPRAPEKSGRSYSLHSLHTGSQADRSHSGASFARSNGSQSATRPGHPSASPPRSPFRSISMAHGGPPGRARMSWPSQTRSDNSGSPTSVASRASPHNSLIFDPRTKKPLLMSELTPRQMRRHKILLWRLSLMTRLRRATLDMRRRVHGWLYISRRWTALVLCEGLLIPAVIVCFDVFTCTYDDDKVPYPHIHKDPGMRCWRGVHILQVAVALTTFTLLLPCALDFVTERAHETDLKVHEPRTLAALRVGIKTLAAATAVLAGGAERERETPLGKYGPPLEGGNPHVYRDMAQLVVLAFSAGGLLILTYAHCPMRGAGARLNALRASFYAAALWTALLSTYVTAGGDRSVYETVVSTAFLVAVVGGLLAALLVYRRTARRAKYFCIPDRPLKDQVSSDDSRVRVLALLVTNEVPPSPHQDGTPPRGSGSSNTVEQEVPAWVMLLQACAAGATSSSSMRVRALEVLERATRSEAGLKAMCSTESYAAVKVALADEDAQVRVRACEVLAAACEQAAGLKHVLALDAENWRVIQRRNDLYRTSIKNALLGRIENMFLRRIIPTYVRFRYMDALSLRMWTRDDLEALDELAVRVMDDDAVVALAANRAVLTMASSELGLAAILGAAHDMLGKDLDDTPDFDDRGGAVAEVDSEDGVEDSDGDDDKSDDGRRIYEDASPFQRVILWLFRNDEPIRERKVRKPWDNPLLVAVLQSTGHANNVVRSAGTELLLCLLRGDTEARTVPVFQGALEHEDWRVRLRTLEICISVLQTRARQVRATQDPEDYLQGGDGAAAMSPMQRNRRVGFSLNFGEDSDGDGGNDGYDDDLGFDQSGGNMGSIVDAILTRDFLTVVARLLTDLESVEVRVSAIELMSHAWDAAGGGQRPSSPSPLHSRNRSPNRIKTMRQDSAEGGEGLDLLMACGAIPILSNLSMGDEPSTSAHSRDLLSKLTGNDEGAAEMLTDQALADTESRVMRRHHMVTEIRAQKAGIKESFAQPTFLDDDEGGRVQDDEARDGRERSADERAQELALARTPARLTATQVRRAQAVMAPARVGGWTPGTGDTRPWRERLDELVEAGGRQQEGRLQAALPRGPHERSEARILGALRGVGARPHTEAGRAAIKYAAGVRQQ